MVNDSGKEGIVDTQDWSLTLFILLGFRGSCASRRSK